MAFIGNKVLLGFEDEPVTDKFSDQLDFTVNKVGGQPDWMSTSPPKLSCKLCSMSLPLVVQVYAPIRHTQYHRTLYVFACINPKCWNLSESWVCLRDQKLEKRIVEEVTPSSVEPPSYWCMDSDNWGDEENGNTVCIGTGEAGMRDLNEGFSEMSVDEKNANLSTGCSEGATGVVPVAIATIEGDEGEVVSVETPTIPQDNVIALLEQAMALPQLPDSKIEFSSFFIGVEEEDLCRVGANDESIVNKLKSICTDDDEDEMRCSTEHYEKSIPAHGDKMFHQFLTRLQANPGQIIRYGGYPLWLYPEEKRRYTCRYCGGEASFELQILPTLVCKLYLGGNSGHLEFGSAYVFSCLRGCWDPADSSPRQEFIIVQKERL